MFIQPCNGQLLCQYHENAPANIIQLPDGVAAPNSRPFLKVLAITDDDSLDNLFMPGDCIWALQANCNLIDKDLRLFLVPAVAVLYRLNGDPASSIELQGTSDVPFLKD